MKRSEIGERVTGRGLLVVGASASVVMIAVACGGKVTWVEDGPQNTGGAGTGTQSTGSKATTTGSTSKATNASSGTGVSSSACQKLCMIPGCANGGATCVPDCIENFYTPGCEAQADAFLNCAVENVDATCEFTSSACDGLQSAYEQCVNPGQCNETGCEGGSGFCKCSGTCFGAQVSAVCTEGPMGVICSCAMNGMEIATCSDGLLSCGLEEGCCAPFFQPFD